MAPQGDHCDSALCNPNLHSSGLLNLRFLTRLSFCASRLPAGGPLTLCAAGAAGPSPFAAALERVWVFPAFCFLLFPLVILKGLMMLIRYFEIMSQNVLQGAQSTFWKVEKCSVFLFLTFGLERTVTAAVGDRATLSKVVIAQQCASYSCSPRRWDLESLSRVWWLQRPVDGVRDVEVAGQRMFCLPRKLGAVGSFLCPSS